MVKAKLLRYNGGNGVSETPSQGPPQNCDWEISAPCGVNRTEKGCYSIVRVDRRMGAEDEVLLSEPDLSEMFPSRLRRLRMLSGRSQ